MLETALGVPRDQADSMNWLKIGGRSAEDLKFACQRANYNTENRLHADPLPIAHLDFWDYQGNTSVDLAHQYFFENLTETAVLQYEDEIMGRQASGIGSRSVVVLHSAIAEIFESYHDFEKAESHLRQAWRIDKTKTHYKSWMAKVALTTDDKNGSYADSLASAVYYQGKESEAVDALGLIKTRERNPNGRGPFVLFGPDVDNQQFLLRVFLSHLLVRQGHLDEAIRLDLVADLVDALQSRGLHSIEVNKMLLNVFTLAQALKSSGRENDAFCLLREVQQFLECRYGRSELVTIKFTHEMTFILASAKTDHINQITLLEGLGRKYVKSTPENLNGVVLCLIARALAFHRLGKLESTTIELDQTLQLLSQRSKRLNDTAVSLDRVREHKRGSWATHDFTEEGCWSDFGASFLVHGKIDQDLLVVIQTNLLHIARAVSHFKTKDSLITLAYKIFRSGGLQEVMALYKCASDTIKAEPSIGRAEQGTFQLFHALMLSISGLCSEDLSQVNEALDICNDPVTWQNDPVRAKRLLAAIYSKKSFVSLQLHGYRPQDVLWMQIAEEAHRTIPDIVINEISSMNETERDVMENLAVILLRHGLKQKSGMKIEEATTLFERLNFTDNRPMSSDKSHPGSNLYTHSLARRIRTIASYHAICAGREHLETQQQALADLLCETLSKGDPSTVAQREYIAQSKLEMGLFREAQVLIDDILWDFRHWRQSATIMVDDHHPQSLSLLEALAQSFLLDGKYTQAMSTLRYTVRVAKCTFPDGEQHPRTIMYQEQLARAMGECRERWTGSVSLDSILTETHIEIE